MAAGAVTTWAQCDACSKWRRVPKALADSLSDDTTWTCKQNPNVDFASCDVPQELSDQEIDQELSSDDEEHVEHDHVRRKKRPAVWQLVKDNIYTHRQRKAQDEDDVMICQCRMRTYGGKGCGPDCLNRLLNIECVPGYCPSCEECDNQMFTKRQYAKIEQRRAGAKGFGLFTNQDLDPGQFVIQYLGEVLEEEEYVRRKVYYQATGQRHYYFMNVGNGEVIDACRKGALGRFINHSCDPNCETQKWVVQGELAIGLFATKAIKAGTELTFDYNFERYGDKPMKCLCGSDKCRGFVGGTQETTPTHKFEDAEDASEDPEPIMVTEAEADAALTAILDQNIGVGNTVWDHKLERRLAKLAKEHGLPLWDDAATDAAGSDAESSGRPDADDEATDKQEGAGRAPGSRAARKPPAKSAAKQGSKLAKRPAARPGQSSGLTEARAAGMVPPRKRLKHAVEENSASTASTSTALPLASAAPDSEARAGNTAALKTEQASKTESSIKSEAAVKSESAADAQLQGKDDGKAAVAKRILSTAAAEIPRPSSASDFSGDTARAAAATAPMESTPTSATTTPAPPLLTRKPSRAYLSALSREMSRSTPSKPVRKRSEIDRRLDTLVPTGRLRDASTAGIVKVLRLFNLCDIGAAGQPPADSRRLRPPGTPPPPGMVSQKLSPSRSPVKGVARHGDRDDGSRNRGRQQRRPSSWDVEVESARLERPELTARQRARMADLSLLLDVIINTTSPAAKQELVRCGLLRQLHSTLGRNVAPSYQVVLRKMLRAVEQLPLTADDVHLTRSAHGTFGDILGLLAQHSDVEVRTKAGQLLAKFPMTSCTRPVMRGGGPSLPGSMPASLGSSSTGFMWSGSGGPPRGRGQPRSQPPARSTGRFSTGGASGRHPDPHPSAPSPAGCAPVATHPSHRSPSLPPHLAQHTPQHSAAGPSGQPDWPPPPSLLAGGSLGRRPLLPLPPPPPLPATPSLHAAATPPAVNGWGSSMGAANGWATPGSEVEAWGQQPLPPPPPLFFTALPDSELPPGIGGSAGTVHVVPPPPVPRLAQPSDGPLHLLAGVPPEGVPASAVMDLVSPVRGVFLQVQPSEADDIHMSDASDAEFVQLPGEVPQEGGSASAHLNGGRGDAGWPGSPTSPALAPSFFDVDLRDPAGSAALEDMPQDWDSPHGEFESYVSEVVRVRLGRHLQAPPPGRIELQDARTLYSKVCGEILDKERQAYEERDRVGAHKLIERRKLELKIKEFIRDSIRRLHAPAAHS